MPDEQSTHWVGLIRQFLDLWIALQLTVGIALLVGISAVTDDSAGLKLLILVVVPLLLATGLVATDWVPDTRILWAGGLAILGVTVGLSLLSAVLEISAPEHLLYVLAITAVLGSYAGHRALKSFTRLTTPWKKG